jgi:AraC-like DNA-binding protein
MSSLHNSLYSLALGACVLLFFVARHALRDTRQRARYLFALLALLSLNFGFEWLMSNPTSPAKSLWLTGVIGLAFFLAPCLWLYARTVAELSVPRLRDLPRAHLLPVAAGLLLLLPLVERAHLGTDFAHPDGVRNPGPVSIHAAMVASISICVAQMLFYLRASVRILRVKARAAKSLLSDIEDRELDTLRLLIVVVAAHCVAGIARTLHCLLLGKDAGFIVLFAISEIMVTLWAVIALLRNTVAMTAPDRQLAREIAEDVEDPKYAKSALDEPTRKRILRKLAEAWGAKSLQRNSQLTLRLLCDELRENPHYVSQVINQNLGTSFYDLVNSRRVSDARELLDRFPDRPVQQIAEEIGFNSKSTFNAAFKQHAGVTPTAYRRRKPETQPHPRSEPNG